MASPWITQTPQRPSTERPWMGMLMLAAVPLLSLVLVRMLWSGSSLWFLTVGIILLGSAAVVFLARRQTDEYGRTLAPEPSRVPLVLAALGVVFLAMLFLPNFADGGSNKGSTPGSQLSQQQQQQALPTAAQSSSTDLSSQVSGVQQQPTVAQQQSVVVQEPVAQEVDSSVSGETYTVVEDDTLWDIATQFDVTVEDIVAANNLEDEADIQIGQELIIPASDSGAETAE